MRLLALPLAVVLLAAAPSFDYTGARQPRCEQAAPGKHATTIAIGVAGTAPAGALVIVPSAGAKHAPGVLWVHWLGEIATTNHTEFVGDARTLAKRGVSYRS